MENYAPFWPAFWGWLKIVSIPIFFMIGIVALSIFLREKSERDFRKQFKK